MGEKTDWEINHQLHSYILVNKHLIVFVSTFERSTLLLFLKNEQKISNSMCPSNKSCFMISIIAFSAALMTKNIYFAEKYKRYSNEYIPLK
jgi:hypothetical protein